MHSTAGIPRTGTWTDLPLSVSVAIIFYAVVLFAPPVLNDGDTYWHIMTGEWILQHGSIPRADPFSYSMPGAPWVAHEWLSDLIMALAYRLGGWNGLVIAFGAAAALSFGLLAHHVERSADRLPALLLIIVGCACITPSLVARPHILALPALVLWTAGLLLARSRGQAPSLLLLPLMTVWANLHGSFVFGLALTAPFAVEAVIEARDRWPPVVRRWGLFIAAAVVMSMVSPHGWHGLVFPFQLMQMRYLANLYEWQPPKFETIQPIELAVLALLYLSLARGVRLPPLRVIILLGLIHLALQHTRQQLLAGVVGTLVLADSLPGTAGRTWPRPPAMVWAVAGIALAVGLIGLRAAYPIVRTDNQTSPVSALEQVPAALARLPVFNDYGYGGYLIFKGVRPFVDGRADMYGDPFLFTYIAATEDPKVFERMEDQYGFRWTIFPADSPAVKMLDAMPGWRRFYTGPLAVVHVRTAADRQ